ncbi:MAG TPA: DUF3175 domain-containing protein [Magnetospirillaceae bacterium]|jgi:hypothetical protein
MATVKSPRARGAKSAASHSRRKTAKSKTAGTKRWSAHVMQTSDAMDIQPRAFASKDPKRIARSLKRSAERSSRRKAGPYQSAMSMLNFYINRGGKNLTASQKKILEQAKVELRHVFGRT